MAPSLRALSLSALRSLRLRAARLDGGVDMRTSVEEIRWARANAARTGTGRAGRGSRLGPPGQVSCAWRER